MAGKEIPANKWCYKMTSEKTKKTETPKMPIFFIEGANGTDKDGMVQLLDQQFDSTLSLSVDLECNMREARDRILDFFDEIERSHAQFDAAIIMDGPIWHYIYAKGSKADKQSIIRRLSNEAKKRFAPTIVFMSCSKRDAENLLGGQKLNGYVESSEKFVDAYRSLLPDQHAFENKTFINTTYEKAPKPISKMLRKASKATGKKIALKVPEQ